MIRCIAVDDEPLALNQLSGYIMRVPFLELVASCEDAFQAVKVLSEQQIDLVFLDINLPDFSGLDFARSLVVKPMIVFVSAYPEYAIDGFKLDAVDYLLKPFDFHDLLKAADKAWKHMEMRSVESLENNVGQLAPDASLFVKTDSKVVRINIADIKYIEGMSEYVRIYMEGEESPIITMLNMKKMEERLPSGLFMRVHRSYIVNLKKITEISRLRIIFDRNVYIPVGDNYKECFQDYINKKSVGK